MADPTILLIGLRCRRGMRIGLRCRRGMRPEEKKFGAGSQPQKK